MATLDCIICHKPFPLSQIERHVDRCLASSGTAAPAAPAAPATVECVVCHRGFEPAQIEKHVNWCLNQPSASSDSSARVESDRPAKRVKLDQVEAAQCPVCNTSLTVPADQLFAHIDECLAKEAKAAQKPSASASTSSSSAASSSSSSKREAVDVIEIGI